MKRTEKKNTIQGNVPDNNLQLPTVLNSRDELLVDFTNKIGVVSSNEEEVDRIISVVKYLEQTRKYMFTESKRTKTCHSLHTLVYSLR
jgi:hypothetical protein